MLSVFCIMSGDGMFLVSFNGQLEYVDITAAAGSTYCCKYEIITGIDWKVIHGLEASVSQTASVAINGDKIVFNLPIEVSFKSTSPSGWPQIILSLYSGSILQGYSRIHLPFQSGLHNLRSNFSKPVPSTYIGYLFSHFGYQPELVRTNLLATGEGNHLIRMISHGYASISINVLTKELLEFGYDVGNINRINKIK